MIQVCITLHGDHNFHGPESPDLLKKFLTKIKGTQSKKEVTSIIDEIILNLEQNKIECNCSERPDMRLQEECDKGSQFFNKTSIRQFFSSSHQMVEFSKCIRANVRETDGFYRYAGDEFLLLLRETGAGEAAQFIKKLDEVLVSIRLSEYDDVGIAISYGAVTLGEVEIGDANHWIKLADERMYQHKKSTKPDSR